MFTVSSYTPGLVVTFKNCIIDVRGNFFYSAFPVNIVFDNCLFKVLNTVNLLNLDYSTDSKYGCNTATETGAGDLTIMNS